jgi:hypothetical protein
LLHNLSLGSDLGQRLVAVIARIEAGQVMRLSRSPAVFCSVYTLGANQA